MEPLMLVTLLAIGMALFIALQVVATRKRIGAEDKVMKGYFLLGLSGLMAKIAMADGRVTGDETELANRFFNNMALADAEKAICIGNFVTARREGLEARDHAKRFMAYANETASLFLYDLLWRISLADGVLHPGEDKLLAEIARYLGLDDSTYANFKAGKRPQYDKKTLRLAGIPPSLVALADQES